jgi:hypothetical protein
MLGEAQRELEILRHRHRRCEEELAALQSSSSRDRAALEVERERIAELELELVKKTKEMEEERIRREKHGMYVEAEQLQAVEAQLIEAQARAEQSEEAHEATKRALSEESIVRARAEDELQLIKDQLASANADSDDLVAEAGRIADKHDAELRRHKEEERKAVAAVRVEAERKEKLCNVLVSRQAAALKKLADENVQLLAMLSGLPAIKNIVAQAPRPPKRPQPLDGKCPQCGAPAGGGGEGAKRMGDSGSELALGIPLSRGRPVGGVRSKAGSLSARAMPRVGAPTPSQPLSARASIPPTPSSTPQPPRTPPARGPSSTAPTTPEYAPMPEPGGAPPFGTRSKATGRASPRNRVDPEMGGIHMGVDELGFSTAWRSQ